MHDHVREVGCTLVSERVTTVGRVDSDSEGFRVETAEGREVTARRVIAATKYDGEYLRGLDDDAALFERDEHHGEGRDRFACDYPDDDGRTPVPNLYVAGVLADRTDQAVVAAGHGAAVGQNVIRDVRRERGYWDEALEPYDWRRRAAELDDEWDDRDRWVEWFDAHRVPDDLDRDEATVERVREEVIDRSLETYLDADEIATRRERGQRRLAEHLDDDALLDALDDETIRRRAEQLSETSTTEN